MNHSSNNVPKVIEQARRGDPDARGQMERDLVPIVRRVIRGGGAASHLDRRILDEAGRWQDFSADQDQLIRSVARSLCAAVFANLHPGGGNRRPSDETLANFSVPHERTRA